MKTAAIWTAKKLGFTLFIAAVAFVVVVSHYEMEIQPWRWDTVSQEEIQPWALNWNSHRVPASEINWEDRGPSFAPNLIPVHAMDWADASEFGSPIIPVNVIDWKSQYVDAGKEVKIIDLDGDEEVLVVKRGDSFSAYRVKEQKQRGNSYANQR